MIRAPRRALRSMAAPVGRVAPKCSRRIPPSRSFRYSAAALIAAALLFVIATMAVEADSPSITVVSPANATYFYPDGRVEIAAQISSVHNIVSANASINGGQLVIVLAYNSASGQWEGEATLLPGHYSMVVSALDDNGDSSASAPVGFTVSQLEVVLNSPSNRSYNSDPLTINASVLTLSPISSVVAEIDGTTNVTLAPSGGYFVGAYSLPEGRHSIRAIAEDSFGRVNSTAAVAFTVDRSPPSVVLLSPTNGKIYNYSRVLINVSVSDLSSITSVVARINGILNIPLPYKDGFYFNDTIPYSEGSTNITIIATDEFGQSNSSVAATFYVDMTPPIVGGLSPGNGSYHRLTNVVIRANFNDAVAGVNASSVRISLDGVDITSSAAISSTGFSYQSSLVQGPHVVMISISDNIGIRADYLWTFTTDITPPSLSVISPASGAITSSLRPQIAASYSDNVEIDPLSLRLLLDGDDVTLYSVVTGSNISYVPPFPLSEGAHNATLFASDYAKNNSTLSWSFTVDGTAPSLVSASPANGSSVTSEFTLINFTFIDAVSGINSSSAALSVDGSAVPCTVSGNDLEGWSFHASIRLADGQHSAVISVADRGGNAAYAEVRFTVDKSTPSVNPISPINGSTVRETAPAISASFSSPAGISFYYVEVDSVRVNASLIGGRFTLTMELADGPHTVFAYFMDTSGKEAYAAWSFTKDSSPPTILSFSPGNGTALNSSQQVIAARYADPISGIDAGSVKLFLDGQEITASSNSSALISPQLNLAEGNYRVSLFVKDNAGNVAWANWSFLVDLTPPSILQSSISNGSQIASSSLRLAFSYGGNVGPVPGSVKLFIDGNDVTQSSAVNSTSLIYSRPLPAGSHVATLVVTDRAGNTVAATWEFSVYQDAPPYLELALPVVVVAVALIAFWAYMRRRYGKPQGGVTPAKGSGSSSP
ncbi:MAG: Ig-like domain-containing protein [Candidatus Methanomethylicia archaeon]|nr:Ig-like domain-containing protein [Candidatus Methanomethylicia archaeon]